MIHLRYYDSDPGPGRGPTLFLAGPTTDGQPGPWRDDFDGRPLSQWRAEFARELAKILPWNVDHTLVVPEFRRKGDGAGWFGDAVAYQGWRGGEDVLAWEEAQMRAADVVVAWCDVRREGPAIGLNARPEVYGLILRYRAAQAVEQFSAAAAMVRLSWVPPAGLPWSPRRLVLGIPETAQKVSRFRQAAAEAGMRVCATLAELAQAAAEGVR